MNILPWILHNLITDPQTRTISSLNLFRWNISVNLVTNFDSSYVCDRVLAGYLLGVGLTDYCFVFEIVVVLVRAALALSVATHMADSTGCRSVLSGKGACFEVPGLGWRLLVGIGVRLSLQVLPAKLHLSLHHDIPNLLLASLTTHGNLLYMREILLLSYRSLTDYELLPLLRNMLPFSINLKLIVWRLYRILYQVFGSRR